MLVDLRQSQGDQFRGVKIAEEANNLVEAYDPVHLEAQEAAGILISCLIKGHNLFNAERYIILDLIQYDIYQTL